MEPTCTLGPTKIHKLGPLCAKSSPKFSDNFVLWCEDKVEKKTKVYEKYLYKYVGPLARIDTPVSPKALLDGYRPSNFKEFP